MLALVRDSRSLSCADHLDALPIADAIADVDVAARHMDSTVAQREITEQLRKLEAQFVGRSVDLVTRGRVLLKEGRLLKVSRRRDHLFTVRG